MNVREPSGSLRAEALGACRIAVAHDYLTQRGGAERVTLELIRALRPDSVVTAIYSPERTFPEFSALKISASLLSRVSLFRRDARAALPFLAAAWSARPRVAADVVVCSSSGWAHGVRVSKGARKVVYCHNPARWLYQTSDYLIGQQSYVKIALQILRPFLVWWDRIAAESAHVLIANSTSVAERIRRAYGREASVIFPPVSVDPNLPQEPIAGLKPPFFLKVGRSRGYKGANLLVDAFRGMPDHTLVTAGGELLTDAPSNVKSLGFVSEAQLRWLYSNARALISVSREDFGLTPIEANAFGTPALLIRAGGFLDSTDEGVSGKFIESESIEAIQDAVHAFPQEWDRDAILRHAAKFSPARFHEAIREVVLQALAGREEEAPTRSARRPMRRAVGWSWARGSLT